MKKKNLVCVSALCALMSFSFVSCDDDNEPSLNIPNVSVTNVSFTDENPEALKVSGTLNWTAPSSVDNVTKYVIYGSSDGTAKDMKIAEVEVGTHSYAITDVVNIGYLLVIAANAEGESSVYASVRVIDFVKDSSFMALYFLNSGKEAEQGFKACVSLNKMVEKYGKEKIEEACGKVLLYTSTPSIRIITTVLKSAPDKQTKHTDKPDYSNSYGITRGVEYYKKGGASK